MSVRYFPIYYKAFVVALFYLPELQYLHKTLGVLSHHETAHFSQRSQSAQQAAEGTNRSVVVALAVEVEEEAPLASLSMVLAAGHGGKGGRCLFEKGRVADHHVVAATGINHSQQHSLLRLTIHFLLRLILVS